MSRSPPFESTAPPPRETLFRFFRELHPAVAVIECDNGDSNASQSGAGQRFFAPGARTHVMSPSPTGIDVQIAQKRGRNKESLTGGANNNIIGGKLVKSSTSPVGAKGE